MCKFRFLLVWFDFFLGLGACGSLGVPCFFCFWLGFLGGLPFARLFFDKKAAACRVRSAFGSLRSLFWACLVRSAFGSLAALAFCVARLAYFNIIKVRLTAWRCLICFWLCLVRLAFKKAVRSALPFRSLRSLFWACLAFRLCLFWLVILSVAKNPLIKYGFFACGSE